MYLFVALFLLCYVFCQWYILKCNNRTAKFVHYLFWLKFFYFLYVFEFASIYFIRALKSGLYVFWSFTPTQKSS